MNSILDKKMICTECNWVGKSSVCPVCHSVSMQKYPRIPLSLTTLKGHPVDTNKARKSRDSA